MKRFLALICGLGVALVMMKTPPPANAAPAQDWALMPHPLAGSMTEAEWTAHLAAISQILREHAAQASDPLAQLEERLQAANWTLAYQIEPMASRLVLGIPRPEDPAEAKELVASASAQLQQAAELWDDLGDSDEIESSERRRLSDSVDMLRAFADGFAAIWHVEDTDEAAQESRRADAASDLALVLEDERRTVATAGMLWQAYLYVESGDCERAIELLPPVLQTAEELNAHDLYARLLRCQCSVALYDGRAAAIALLARLEERCKRWDPKDDRNAAARRTVAFVRRRVLADWAAALDAAGEAQRASWCRSAIETIDQDYFSEGEERQLLRLGYAAPAVVDLQSAASILESAAAEPMMTQPTASQPVPAPSTMPSTEPVSATQPAAGGEIGE